jgi:hypothetical protein
LFTAASEALAAEDDALATLFDKSRRWRGATELAHYEHEGLSYGLFENTLVYVILKAWLPIANVIWEAPYEDNKRHHADLVIRRAHRTDHEYFFEAKWWMGKRAIPSITKDVRRLCRPRVSEADGRYVLAFWWNRREHRSCDDEAIVGVATKHAAYGVSDRYVGRFATRRRDHADAEFILCAFQVEGRSLP